MIRKILHLFVFAVLLTPITTQAQSAYGGAGFGVDFFSGSLGFNLDTYLGFEDAISDNLDIRANFGLVFASILVVKVAGDLMYNLPFNPEGATQVYVGGGPRFGFGAGFNFGLGILGNLDYALSDELSIFAEADLDMYFLGGVSVWPGIELGTRFSF